MASRSARSLLRAPDSGPDALAVRPDSRSNNWRQRIDTCRYLADGLALAPVGNLRLTPGGGGYRNY